MLSGITAFLVSLPATLGIVNLWKKFSLKFMRYKNSRMFTVIPIDNCDDTEFILRDIINRIQWADKSNCGIFILDCGMSEEARTICARIIEKYPSVKVVTHDELSECMENFWRKPTK